MVANELGKRFQFLKVDKFRSTFTMSLLNAMTPYAVEIKTNSKNVIQNWSEFKTIATSWNVLSQKCTLEKTKKSFSTCDFKWYYCIELQWPRLQKHNRTWLSLFGVHIGLGIRVGYELWTVRIAINWSQNRATQKGTFDLYIFIILCYNLWPLLSNEFKKKSFSWRRSHIKLPMWIRVMRPLSYWPRPDWYYCMPNSK